MPSDDLWVDSCHEMRPERFQTPGMGILRDTVTAFSGFEMPSHVLSIT
jgi:hypothetical protein